MEFRLRITRSAIPGGSAEENTQASQLGSVQYPPTENPVRSGRQRTGYGVDSPRPIVMLFVAGAISVGTGFVVAARLVAVAPAIALAAVYVGVTVGLLVLAVANLLLWSSLLGKPREVEKMLHSIPWGGNETVLDIGCGRGLPLVPAARRLSSGEAVGIDLWRKQDLTGNTPASTMANAVAEGVQDRIVLVKCDSRFLPFVSESFDMVLSSLALSHLSRKGREVSLSEAVRVLKQGGRVSILDTVHADEISKSLTVKGLTELSVSRLRFGLFPPAYTIRARTVYQFAKHR